MGLRAVGIATLVVGYSIWKVWPGGQPSAEPVIVAHVRDARVPAVVQPLRVAAIELEVDDPEEDADETTAQPALDVDGLTDEERWESQLAELEDYLTSSYGGAIHGIVRDAGSAERLAGVTVVATGPNLEGAQAVVTDERGYYAHTELPPGDYRLTFYYLDTTVEQSSVQVIRRVATPVMQALRQDVHPIRPFVLTLDDAVSIDDLPSTVSFTGIESTQNTYVVDSIDITGLTFGDDE